MKKPVAGQKYIKYLKKMRRAMANGAIAGKKIRNYKRKGRKAVNAQEQEAFEGEQNIWKKRCTVEDEHEALKKAVGGSAFEMK